MHEGMGGEGRKSWDGDRTPSVASATATGAAAAATDIVITTAVTVRRHGPRQGQQHTNEAGDIEAYGTGRRT